jgi:hypothetical protein
MGTYADLKIGNLLAGRRKIGRFPFPGLDGIECGVRLLSDREIDEARADAAAYLDAKWKRAGFSAERCVNIDPNSLEREHMRQCIVRAIVDPDSDVDKPVPLFPSVEKVRDLDSTVVQAFWEIYLDWHEAIDPRTKLTDEEVEELADALKKEPNGPAVWAHLEPVTLRSLLRGLVSRLQT